METVMNFPAVWAGVKHTLPSLLSDLIVLQRI